MAERLGLGAIASDDFAKHGEPGEAVLTALADLVSLGLVDNFNVHHGNVLTPAGRDVAALGFGELRDAAMEVPLSDHERTFLAKLHLASAVDGRAGRTSWSWTLSRSGPSCGRAKSTQAR